MPKKLFVANFGLYVTENDLEKLFKKYGEVYDVTIWRNWRTRESCGWGFVEMVDEGDAADAIAGLNRKEWRGQRLKVSEARPKSDLDHP